jgi:CubicO group peptidase (beta-lactamase class C family)
MGDTDPRASIVVMLERASRAGEMPGAVAAWGAAAERPTVVEIGRAAVTPEPEPASRDTWYDLASLTKPLVVTTLCLLAFRRGDLGLQTRVGEVLDEERHGALAELTVGQLLSHSSGLPSWYPLYAAGPEPRGALRTLSCLGLEFRPGTRVLYSCLDFILLGLILERLASSRLDRLFEGEVVRPLGLKEALGFQPDPTAIRIAGGSAVASEERAMTAGRGLDPDKVPPCERHHPDDGNARFLGGVAGNAGLFGTVTGVWRLATEYLIGHGSLLAADEVRTAVSEAARGPDQVRALGWQLASTPGSSAGPALDGASYGHTGFSGPSLWLDPRRSAIFVLLTNRHHPAHRGVDLHPLRRRFHSLAVAELDRS